jgi:putative hydrolase of the HAD superfamily
MPKKIKAIIFDLGGVITHGGYLDFLHTYCAECMTSIGKKKILQLERQVNLAKISEQEFYKQIEKVFHVHLSPNQMHKIILKNMKADKALTHLIPKLKKAKIILFTNSIGAISIEVLRRHKIKNLFDKVFISTKMHMAKPDRKAFEFVLGKIKLKPGETLMVDDRLENIAPARKIGMNGVVYKNSAQFAKELKKYELV